MSTIVLDTNVFLKLEGDYKDLFECLSRNRVKIVVSKEAIREYELVSVRNYKAPSVLLIQNFITSLEKQNKLKTVGSSRINARITQYRKQLPQYPYDPDDRKWVDLAISEYSSVIISDDYSVYNLRSIRYNGSSILCVQKYEYINSHCN